MCPQYHRPPPVLHPHAPTVDFDAGPLAAAEYLASGGTLRLFGHYGHGADILDALHHLLGPLPHGLDGEARRHEVRRRRRLACGLLVPIDRDRVDAPGTHPIRLLADLYPDRTRYWLPFVEVQALRAADQRFQEGVQLAVLGHKLHPWYGVYAPTRTVHLELFATWLQSYDGARTTAIDMGTGCGVLAFQLARAGFSSVVAADINPNAIESVRRDLARHTPPPPITPVRSDLFANVPEPADLLVFNPPWMAGAIEDPLDRALFFDSDLFPRFFEGARTHLNPDGRVVLLYSSVLRLLRPDLPHPVDTEVDSGRWTVQEKLQRRVKPQNGRKTREKVEVWVLRPT
jgi:hypothetical protein